MEIQYICQLFYRNPTFGKSVKMTLTLLKWDLGVLRDSQNFRVQL